MASVFDVLEQEREQAAVRELERRPPNRRQLGVRESGRASAQSLTLAPSRGQSRGLSATGLGSRGPRPAQHEHFAARLYPEDRREAPISPAAPPARSARLGGDVRASIEAWWRCGRPGRPTAERPSARPAWLRGELAAPSAASSASADPARRRSRHLHGSSPPPSRAPRCSRTAASLHYGLCSSGGAVAQAIEFFQFSALDRSAPSSRTRPASWKPRPGSSTSSDRRRRRARLLVLADRMAAPSRAGQSRRARRR